MSEYKAMAWDDAKDAVLQFSDEIAEHLIDEDSAPGNPLNDIRGFDSYRHETHVDKIYGLLEAASLLDELHNYEEDDHGLWEGLEPRRAVEAQAAYTYGNAVLSMFGDLCSMIEENDTVRELLDSYNTLLLAEDEDEDDDVDAKLEGIRAAIKAQIELMMEDA